MSVLEEKIRLERCHVWMFTSLLEKYPTNKVLQRIFERHEALLAQYQQWRVVEVAR